MAVVRRARALAALLALPAVVAGGALLGAWAARVAGLPGVAVVVAAAFAAALVAEVAVAAPLRALVRDLERVRLSGDLARPLRRPPGPVRPVVDAAAGVVDAVASVMGKVFFTSTLVGTNAASLTTTAGAVGTAYASQEDAVARAVDAVAQVLDAVGAMTDEARAAADRAEQSRALTAAGSRDVLSARDQMEAIAGAVATTVGAVEALGRRVRDIDEMVATITGIAEQTNLLALNATIESARAGESGRGFAVVAQEVKRLAETTAESTTQITGVVDGVRRDTEEVLALVARTAGLAQEGARLTTAATDALGQIETAAGAASSSVASIIERAADQRGAGELLRDEMTRIGELASATHEAAGQVDTQAGGLEHLAANLRELESVFVLGDRGRESLDVHLRMPDVVRAAAASVAAVLERAVGSGRVGLDDLFDTDYRPLSGTSPQKFTTRFDRLTDELFPPVQEPVLASDPHLAYAGAVDRNGYFPTHNLVFSKPLTGNPALDLVGNRTKRIFDDPVGRRCGAHTMPFLVQTYRRDTGEVMHDISAPITVLDRHWGGFRIGYRA